MHMVDKRQCNRPQNAQGLLDAITGGGVVGFIDGASPPAELEAEEHVLEFIEAAAHLAIKTCGHRRGIQILRLRRSDLPPIPASR